MFAWYTYIILYIYVYYIPYNITPYNTCICRSTTIYVCLCVYYIYIIIYIYIQYWSILYMYIWSMSQPSPSYSGPTTPGRGRRSNGRSGCSQRRGEEGQLATETRWISVILGPWISVHVEKLRHPTGTQLIKLWIMMNYEYLSLRIFWFWIQNSRFTDGTVG